MKKLFNILFLATTLILLLSVSSFAKSPKIKSIDVNEIKLDNIDKSKVDDLKDKLNNIDFRALESSSVINEINKNEIISGNINSVNTDNVNIKELTEIYHELSTVISNEEIADLIKDNSKLLTDAGISKETLDASESLLRTFDSDAVIDIIENDLDVNKLLDMYKNGASFTDIISSIIKDTSFETKLNILSKLLFSNFYVRIAIVILIFVAIYSVFITSLIFAKAEKSKFSTLIPIYRDIIHLKICGLSPWLLLLFFIPIIGWLMLMAVAIIARFELSKHFGHGFFFGLGLLIAPILFRTIIALSSNEYIEDYEEEYE